MTLLYDMALGVAAITGAEMHTPQGVRRGILQALDTLDVALVVGLVLVMVAWVGADRTRLVPGCAAMVGLSVPALSGIETLATAAGFVGFVLFAALSPGRAVHPVVVRLSGLVTMLSFAAAGWVSLPRALLALVAVALLVWTTRRGDQHLR